MQLKQDTSSAKTEEITPGKYSSQTNLNEVAEQFKIRLEIMQQFKTLLYYISWILKRTAMSQKNFFETKYSLSWQSC